MARVAAGEAVPLHDARVALADARAGDVHVLPGLEDVHLDLGAGLQLRALALGEAEFDEALARQHARLGEMRGDRLGQPGSAAGAECDLDGPVAFGRRVLDLHDAIRQRLDDRHRQGVACVGENPSHAGLAADQTYGHDLYPFFTAPAAIGRRCPNSKNR